MPLSLIIGKLWFFEADCSAMLCYTILVVGKLAFFLIKYQVKGNLSWFYESKISKWGCYNIPHINDSIEDLKRSSMGALKSIGQEAKIEPY